MNGMHLDRIREQLRTNQLGKRLPSAGQIDPPIQGGELGKRKLSPQLIPPNLIEESTRPTHKKTKRVDFEGKDEYGYEAVSRTPGYATIPQHLISVVTTRPADREQ